MQLDLFIDLSDPKELRLGLIEDKLKEVKASSDNVRRGIFARHNELSKLYVKLQNDYDTLKLEMDQIRRQYAGRKELFAGSDGNVFTSIEDNGNRLVVGH